MIVARTIMTGVKGHFVHRFSEWVFTWILAAFASSLLGDGDTFASSHSYSYMASLMTEVHWGVLLLTIAASRFLALAINGSFPLFRRYSPAIRSMTAWCSSIAWIVLSISMFYGNPIGTGWRIYLVLAVADVGLAIIIAGEHGRSSVRHGAHGRRH